MSDELTRQELRELRDRLAGLEAQRTADREHDRDSRHAQGELVSNALGSLHIQLERGLTEVRAQLSHQDACTDAVRVEAHAARQEVREARGEVAAVAADLQEVKDEVGGIRAAILDLQTTAKHAANRSPAIVGAAVLVDIGHAYGHSRGWW